jgi:plasmid maintenance system killer protein
MGKAEFIDIILQIERIKKNLSGSAPEVPRAFYEALNRIHGIKSMDDLKKDHGLRWEKLENKFFPGTRDPLYSFRITDNWRAICRLHTGPVIEIVMVSDHDGAY